MSVQKQFFLNSVPKRSIILSLSSNGASCHLHPDLQGQQRQVEV